MTNMYTYYVNTVGVVHISFVIFFCNPGTHPPKPQPKSAETLTKFSGLWLGECLTHEVGVLPVRTRNGRKVGIFDSFTLQRLRQKRSLAECRLAFATPCRPPPEFFATPCRPPPDRKMATFSICFFFSILGHLNPFFEPWAQGERRLIHTALVFLEHNGGVFFLSGWGDPPTQGGGEVSLTL